ncbi:MAG: hypothetical protein DI539_00845 [Flavobacterium psychrophilum]|nr:MAG: hypothetical protein DI539_00845 [Flavobacterium psychrophilum]
MIKIQINDKEQLKLDYLDKISPELIEALKKMDLSLAHLLEPSKINDTDISKAKHLTIAIVNILRTPAKPASYFKKSVYRNGVKNYAKKAKKLMIVNLSGLSGLIKELLDLTSGSLDSLLVGDAESIKRTNDELLNKHLLGTPSEIDILKLAFKYKESKLGGIVREFFYDAKLTVYCPYCNQNLAIRNSNKATGVTGDSFQLDHFFDQDNYPLLALSLFNLVPSDSNCNTVNKKTKRFSDELHLNPYISGFGRDMVFRNIYDPLTLEIFSISLDITVPRNSPRHLQLIGDFDKPNESLGHGNINVFQLETRYNRADVLKKAAILFQDLKNDAVNKSSLDSILAGTGLANSYSNFVSYYERKVRAEFHEKDFGKEGYSKLYRDILDQVYGLYPTTFNKEVREIIEKSYDKTVRGE